MAHSLRVQLSREKDNKASARKENLRVETEGSTKMKKNIHPKVRQVVFKDTSTDFSFLGTSTMDSKETIKWEDGKSYPLIKLEISSASHPFFTGKQQVRDTGGRIERFKKKYGKK
jgi:large subunit ribosomal protein L31